MLSGLTLTLSGVIEKDGVKKACVCFMEGDRMAEGYIPDCKITLNKGFTDEEVQLLEEYLQEHLNELKQQAVKLNPFYAMMKD